MILFYIILDDSHFLLKNMNNYCYDEILFKIFDDIADYDRVDILKCLTYKYNKNISYLIDSCIRHGSIKCLKYLYSIISNYYSFILCLDKKKIYLPVEIHKNIKEYFSYDKPHIFHVPINIIDIDILKIVFKICICDHNLKIYDNIYYKNCTNTNSNHLSVLIYSIGYNKINLIKFLIKNGFNIQYKYKTSSRNMTPYEFYTEYCIFNEQMEKLLKN
jgi:hypothetical protein